MRVAEEPATGPVIPDGFDQYSDDIAGRFIDADCSVSLVKWNHLEVYAINGCPQSLYVEANIFDSAGRVIGYINDATGSLDAAQVDVVEFRYFDDAAERVELTEVNCY